MAFRIQGSDGSIHTVYADPDYELGLVPVMKVKNLPGGGWDIMYAGIVLEHLDTESAADSQLDDLVTHCNSREAGSVKTVAYIDSLS